MRDLGLVGGEEAGLLVAGAAQETTRKLVFRPHLQEPLHWICGVLNKLLEAFEWRNANKLLAEEVALQCNSGAFFTPPIIAPAASGILPEAAYRCPMSVGVWQPQTEAPKEAVLVAVGPCIASPSTEDG